MHSGTRSLFGDPDLFLYRLDVSRDRAWFVRMSGNSYRSSTFLDSRIRREQPGGIEIRLQDLERLAVPTPGSRRPCRFIFHIGHTCSTLLSRAVGELPGSLVLREPQVFAHLSHWADAGRVPPRFTRERWGKVRDAVMGLLARTYGKEDMAVIKPSSLANGFMRETLGSESSRRAVFVYSSLPTFLASMLRSEDNQADGAADLAVRLRGRSGRLRAASVRRQPLARKFAALWILHMDLFLDLVPSVPPARLRSLDADDFVAAPGDALAELARAFGFRWSASEIASVVDGPLFRRDAKRPARRYDAQARRTELSRAVKAWKTEIDDASAWVARVTRDRPIPEVLPRRLGGARPA